MPDTGSLLLFSGAALLLLVVPGPSVLYIVTRSVAQGRRAGLASVAGIHVGSLVHVGAAVAGLSALLVASATAFTAVKLAGAAYLVYLGVTTLRGARSVGVVEAGSAERPLRRIFSDGVVVNVLNPKTAVFFLAFAPQFVDAEHGSASSQVVVLGLLFIALGLLSDGAYALTAAWIGQRLTTRRSRRREVGVGVTYIGLGTVTALAGGSHTS